MTLRPLMISSVVSSGTTRCSSIGGNFSFSRRSGLRPSVCTRLDPDEWLERTTGSCESPTAGISCLDSIVLHTTTSTPAQASRNSRQTSYRFSRRPIVCQSRRCHGEGLRLATLGCLSRAEAVWREETVRPRRRSAGRTWLEWGKLHAGKPNHFAAVTFRAKCNRAERDRTVRSSAQTVIVGARRFLKNELNCGSLYRS